MKNRLLSLMIFLFAFNCLIAQVKVSNLLTENLNNPVGLDIIQPRFSWQLVSDVRNTMQSAFELKVSDNLANLSSNKNLIWNSGKVLSDSSVYIAYKGIPLKSGAKYYWQVRVWDNSGKASKWSETATFQMGFLNANDWKASWISPGFVEDTVLRPSPIFRKEFATNKEIKSATAYITAHGMYEAVINGQRVGNDYLTPGWTVYNKRIQYQVYDVSGLLKKGANAIGVTLGSGWFRGSLAWNDNKNLYGKELALLMQIEISYTDGSIESIVTDGSWKSSTGSIVYSEIYHGETVDYRLEKTGWTLPAFKDDSWSGVKVQDFPKNILVGTYNEPIKKHEVFKPVKIFKTPSGEQVIDFGQNLVGFVQMKVSGKAGDQITLKFAEVLDKEGDFYIENLRAAKVTDVITLKGGGEEIFEPKFTFHGFRYLKIEGFKGEVKPENFTAIALYSAMKPTGTFSCSNELINQLQHNIQWGQRGNFLDVPTDCPQRDERLGWTGDAQAFSRTATFNMNVHNFFVKWLKDVALDQNEDGAVAFVVPNVLGKGAVASTGWADVATIAPWNIYLAYGDKRILENQYQSMKAWLGYMKSKSNNYLWNTGFHFGDWLFYSPQPDDGGRAALTDKYLIAQCFWAHSTQLLINAAKVLQKTEDITFYTNELNKIKEAFKNEYVTPNGGLVSSTQTAYVLALQFDMLPENLRDQAVNRLVVNINNYETHLTTGFLGTPYLCHVLSRFGKTDLAYKLLLQETYPSWLYPVKMGATTIWERWDGIKPDGSFQTPGMNSFNHYAYGAIGDWMYRVIAGIDTETDSPGYRKIRIEPHMEKGLTNASANLNTYYGNIGSGWKIDDKKTTYEIEIPANTTATLVIPAQNLNNVSESGKALNSIKDFKSVSFDKGVVTMLLGSGKYNFVVAQ